MARALSAAEEATAPRVLAPRANPDLFGQEAAEAQLLRAWRSGRLAHAFLLCGPRGLGKATLAYRFARFVLAGAAAAPSGGLFAALAPPTPESLALGADHPVFHRVAAGSHADLLTVECSYDEKRKRLRDEIVIDDVRAVAEFFALTAAEGGWRIAIVDAADDLNRNAANALLKVLEEPPPRGLLFLVSHAPGRLLPTIRSRCQRLALQPLAEATVAGILGRYYPALGADDTGLLARLAEGSAGRALELAHLGGGEACRALLALFEMLPRFDVAQVHALGERLGRPQAAAQFRTFVELLVWWLARLVRAGAGEPAEPPLAANEPALIGRLLAAAKLDRWVEVWEKVAAFLARADALSLDRRHAIVLVFAALAQTASGQRPDLPE